MVWLDYPRPVRIAMLLQLAYFPPPLPQLRLQQLVGVEVEGHALGGLQQFLQIGFAPGGAEVAPGVDEVDVFAVEEFVLFDDADGAAPGPGL